MPQPPAYRPTTDFSDEERDNVGGRSTIRTAALDAELSNLQATLAQTLTNLALNQRDDGEIRDGRVKLFTLAADVRALLAVYGATPRGAWTTLTLYGFKDLVSQGGNTYMAVVPHVSGVFATDLAAGKWLLFSLGTSPSATQIPFTATATIAATNVQAAIEEADTENRALTAAVASDLASLIASLASPTADALIGMKRSAVGAVATNLHKFYDGQFVTLTTDFIGDAFNPALDANYALTTAAFNSAIATGRRVYVPAGTYVCEDVQLASGCEIFGDGWNTIIKQRANATANHWCFYLNAYAASDAGYSTNAFGIHIHDMQFLGRVDTEGFLEFAHLVHLSGVTNALIERCLFKAFKGDGLYIGSTIVGNERHNKNVTVRDCHFDGVNRDNRNGISVIDCNGLIVEGCYFSNCTRSNMPGAIDIEPDAAVYHIIRDIKIIGNKFEGNGGSNGAISLYFPDAAWTSQPSGILIQGNDIDGTASYTDRGIYVLHTGNATTTRRHDVRILGNRVRRVARGFELGGLRNVDVADNHFDDITAGALLGFNDGTRKNMNVQMRGNTFSRMGNDNAGGGVAINIFDVDYLDLIENTWIDSGRANGTLGNAIDFNTGTSSYVNLIGNKILNPGARTTVAIQKEAGHTFTRATNRYYLNDVVSAGAMNFDAEDSDIIESTFTPIVEGATTAGVGTYVTQLGRYMRQGKRVRGQLNVSVNAGHTGTGQIEVSLPLNVKSQPSALSVTGSVYTEGLTGGDMTSLLITGAAAGGVTGALRLYTNNSAAAAGAVNIPAGAFGIVLSFDYTAA